MSDYRIEVKVRNNNILRKLKECGYETIAAFCKRNNKKHWQNSIGKLANLKKSPLDREGRFLKIVEQMCEILQCVPEELFSDAQLTTELETNKRTIEVNEAEMRFMIENKCEQLSLEEQTDLTNLPSKIADLLETLTTKEAKVLEMRFGVGKYATEHTLEEVAKACGVTGERIRQVQAKALRKLRHPSRAVAVKDYRG